MKNYKVYLYIVLFGIVLIPSTVLATTSSCPLGVNVTKDLAGILRIIKIVAPILVIGYTIYEGIVALTKGGVEAEGKKFFNKFVRRVGAAVVLFAVPVIVDQMMQIMNVWDESGHCELEAHEIDATAPDTDDSKSVDYNQLDNEKIVGITSITTTIDVGTNPTNHTRSVSADELDKENKVNVNERNNNNNVNVSNNNNGNTVSVTDTTSAIKIKVN
jgi:hypothetical protein